MLAKLFSVAICVHSTNYLNHKQLVPTSHSSVAKILQYPEALTFTILIILLYREIVLQEKIFEFVYHLVKALNENQLRQVIRALPSTISSQEQITN